MTNIQLGSSATSSTEYSRNVETADQQFQRDLASHAHEQDLYKHIASLSTGSILLMVTFLEKLFSHPSWKALIVVALVAFTTSIIGAITMQALSVLHTNATEESSNRLATPLITVMPMLCGFGGFLIGIVALAIFAVRNLGI